MILIHVLLGTKAHSRWCYVNYLRNKRKKFPVKIHPTTLSVILLVATFKSDWFPLLFLLFHRNFPRKTHTVKDNRIYNGIKRTNAVWKQSISIIIFCHRIPKEFPWQKRRLSSQPLIPDTRYSPEKWCTTMQIVFYNIHLVWPSDTALCLNHFPAFSHFSLSLLCFLRQSVSLHLPICRLLTYNKNTFYSWQCQSLFSCSLP